MGIYDRDWYKDRDGQRSKAKANAEPSAEPPAVDTHVTTDEPLIKRVAVRRSTYQRWLRSQQRGMPAWLMVLFWLTVAVGIFAVMQQVVR